MDNKKFKQIRNILNLTQAELSEELQISLSSVQYYEQGRQKIPSKVEMLLSKLLGSNNSFIENYEEDNNGPKLNTTYKDSIGMKEVTSFIMENLEEFKKSPEIQILFELERKKAQLELTKQYFSNKSN